MRLKALSRASLAKQLRVRACVQHFEQLLARDAVALEDGAGDE